MIKYTSVVATKWLPRKRKHDAYSVLYEFQQNLFPSSLDQTLFTEELEEKIKENNFYVTSIMNNVSIVEKRLDRLSTELSLHKEVINSVQHNLTILFERFQNTSMHGQFSVDQVTQPATQSKIFKLM